MVPEKKRGGNFTKDREIRGAAMCRVQFKDRERSKDLMLMLGFNESMDRLAVAYSGHWYGHGGGVVMSLDGH